MTDFSFQNKAYDLLLNLKEDKSQLPIIKSVKELRLLIDIIKEQYPIYATADNQTLIDFIKDIFKINPLQRYMYMANHTEDNQYRPIECFEIKPGVRCRMEGSYVDYKGKSYPFYYYHTFPIKEMSNKEYAHEFDKIWFKAQKGKACIINTYKFKIGDKVRHIIDHDAVGIIRSRIPAGKRSPLTNPYEFSPNAYIIDWSNIGTNSEISLQCWYNEDSLMLLQTNKLEVKPMKTFNRRLIEIEYEKFSPKEWLKQIVKEGYDRAVYLTLLQKNTERREFGWIKQTKKIEIGYNTFNTLNAVKNKLRHVYHLKDKNIKNIQILDDINFNKKKDHKVKRHKVDTISTPKPQKYQRKLTAEEKQFRLLNTKNGSLQTYTSPHKLVCVKYIIPGEDGFQTVSRIPVNEAKKLVGVKDNYEYASKTEYQTYLNHLKKVKDEKKPGLTVMGTDFKTKLQLPRKTRRYDKQKYRKGSRLVKEQFVPKIIPEEEIEINSINPTLNTYDEEGNIIGKERFHMKYIKPAHVIIKRILTRIKAWIPIKITKEIINERKAQSEKDKAKYVATKFKKPLSVLKEEFAINERRNDKYSERENWSKHFQRLVTLITTGNKYIDEDKSIYINKKGLFAMVSNIINLDAKLHWDNIKILDFIRYIRQTTHGVFDKESKVKKIRPSKAKKVKKQVEFEPIMFATKINATKLKYNLPNEDKKLIVIFKDGIKETEGEGIFKEGNIIHESGDIICPINSVIKWKYEDDKDFSTMLIDEGGGFTEIPIKFKRKKNEIKFKRIKKANNNSEKSE